MGNNRFKDATPFLLYCAAIFAWGGIMFGLDVGSFGAIQALPSFLNDFGTLDEDGNRVLTTTRRAIMNGSTWRPRPADQSVPILTKVYHSCLAR